MKRIAYWGILFMCTVSLATGQTAAEINQKLLPPVKELEKGSGTLKLDAGFSIAAQPGLENEAAFLKQYISEHTGLDLQSADPSKIGDSSNTIVLAQQAVPFVDALLPALDDEEMTDSISGTYYMLNIEGRQISVVSSGRDGVFYGVQTLRQLLDLYGAELPQLTIIDWPDFHMRGITDDMSRGQVSTMENFKTIIRFLARFKMNVYMPYIEDIFQFKSYPSFGKNRGAMTAAEWRELQDYAKQYHVEIIPIFQTLGHYENILLQEEFMHLAEFPGAASLNIANEEIYTFLKKTLDEVIAAFDSEWFHIGADESWDVGKYATKGMAERHSIATVHARHYNRVYDMVKERGKKVMMYGDIVLQHPEILNQIPEDMVMFDWHYFPTYHYPSVETFAKAGQPIIVSPGIHNWRNFFPRLSFALTNIHHLTQDGFEHNAMGAITSNWGDYGAMNLRELNYYGNAFAAASAWQHDYDAYTEFEQNFARYFYGDDSEALLLAHNALAQMAQQVEWLTIVSHPFHAGYKSDLNTMRESAGLTRGGAEIKDLLENIDMPRNEEHLDYLRLSADVYAWYGRLSTLRLQMLDAQMNPPGEEQTENLQAAAVQLGLDAAQLGERFGALWKRTNRPDNVQRMTGLWQNLSRYLLIKSDEIATGNLAFNGTLPGPFITYPSDEKQSLPESYLRYHFEIDGTGDEAVVQLIANSHAILFINGEEVGEVVARKSLSAVVEEARVMSFNAKPYLRKGENVIAVKVRNYTGGRASAHVWLQVKEDDFWRGPLLTSTYWKAADKLFEDWAKIDFDDSNWPNAIDAGITWEISRPYFDHDIPSRIEYYSRGGH